MEFKLLTNENLKSLFLKQAKPPDIIMIDVRESGEYNREHIAGSYNIPLAKIATTDFSSYKNKKVIFYCRLGNRTRSSENILAATGLKEICCMEGGIEQWKKCGFPTVIDSSAPIDIMRQVQITVGLLILVSLFLTYAVSPLFILLTVFAGLGLLIAGITGFCGMAKLLMFLPWNQFKHSPDCSLNRRK